MHRALHKENEQAIKATVDTSFCGSANLENVVRNKTIVRMESALSLWIQVLRKTITFWIPKTFKRRH